MKIDWRREWPVWTLLAALFAMAAMNWSGAPERIPMHWGLDGRPDGWGGRFAGLLAIPLEALGIYALLLFLPRIDPGRANYASFAWTYTVLRWLVVAFMAVLQTLIVLAIHGRGPAVNRAVPISAGALFFVLGNLLGKLRPNWFVGIRTPWTLSSKDSWVRTHRAGGWAFMAFGLLMASCGVVQQAAYTIAAGITMAAGLVALIVYSYAVWKRDPDKIPPAGTTPAEP